MYARRCYVIGMDYSTYTADSVKFISIIKTLRGAIPPIGNGIGVVLSHDAVFCLCIPADFDRLGVDAEHIFRPIYFHVTILRQLTSSVELPATNKVW